MKWCLLGVVLFFSGHPTYSMQVKWDTITAEYDSIGTNGELLPVLTFYSSHSTLDLIMDMAVTPLDSGVEIKAITYSAYLEYANAFVGAEPGDVVNGAYIDTNPKRFSYARFSDVNGDDFHADYSIILKDDESAFLAFRNETMYGSTTYGWIELGLGEDGLVRVLHSAWDSDGDPITVGATPEPVSGLLLLVGGALLALRRQRKML